jgi:hypothetical protein
VANIRRGGDLAGQCKREAEDYMAEVLMEFAEPVTAHDGTVYFARACGAENDRGRWQGWIEFVSSDGTEVLRSARETTQPNRVDTLYWATGLTPVYLEGSLQRTLRPVVVRTPAPPPAPAYDEPAEDFIQAPPRNEAVLNPFSVYRKGEALLRDQLHALSPWHLVNIIRAHDLSELSDDALNTMTASVLVELIVANTKLRASDPVLG